ncbi:hypothetical protein glysoja_033340 [Glycine soja]|uniref:Uncharacterized protein n=1 Tax=Glycine soja TaxID=3848 RepID=A0A0B2Q2B0_GLYSO|nr:hypothetical protein glysoja_033340 [Glycine soja]
MGTNSEEHGGSGKPNVVIPPQIIAEAISMIHDIDIRNGTKHWVSEAQRNYWRVLLDASALVLGKGRLYLGLHRPDFLVCCLDNTHSNPSRITCLLVRTKSFDTSTASSQVNG